MKLGEAFIEVRADRDRFDGDLSDIARRVRSGQGGAGDVSSALRDALIGGAFLAGAKKAVDAASGLQQAVGGTAAVFGESAESVGRWAKDAADAAGLSERAARELTAQIGGLLKGFGFAEEEAASLSTQLAQLGADLAATFGGRPEEAVQALAAALRGETDPIERYGIALNQALVNQRAVALGLADSTSKVDQHAKAQATLSLITERSADAQGQFAREADTAAGSAARSAAKAENAAADLGENLLPIYTKLSETVGIVADAFGSLPEPVQTGIIAIAGIAALAGPVRSSVDALGGLATMARTRVPQALNASAVSAYDLSGNLSKVGVVLGGLGIAAAVVGIAQMGREMDGLKISVNDLTGAYADMDAATEEQVRKQLELAEAAGGLDELFSKTADASVPAAERLLEFAEANGLSAEQVAELREIIERKRASDVQGAEDQAAYAAEVDGAAGATQNLTDRIKEEQEALEGLLDATLAQFDANIDYRRSIDDTEDALAELLWLTNAGKAGTEEYEDAALDAEEALLRQAEAAVRLYEDTAKANGETLTAQEKTDLYRDSLAKLRDGLAPGSPLRKALDGYIADLESIPKEITTYVNFVRPTISGARGDQLLSGTGYAAGGDVMDGLFRVHDGELMRKEGERVEVLAGSPTPLAFDGVSEEQLLTLRSIELLLGALVSNTSTTTARSLRGTKLEAAVI